jgi:hypothetical protein
VIRLSSPSASAISASSTLSRKSRSSDRIAFIPFSSFVRSRISFWAFSGSFQKSGRSESAVSSSNRTWARSQSKTPPEQSHGGFDLFGQRGDFGAH